MIDFDYEQHRVIGLVEDKLGDNATIDIIGYCDDSFNAFNILTHSEVLETFPTRGKVFAYRFSQYHKNLKGTIVCIWVHPSNNDGPENYVWNWNGDVIECGKRILPLKDFFSDNGQYNYDILKNNNLLNIDEDILVYCENRIYQIIPDNSERIIKFWEESSLNITTIDRTKYFVGISLPKHDGIIDITNDEQLINWYLSKVIKKDWANITQNKSFKTTELFIKELLVSLKNIDASTLTSRLNRLISINSNLSLTFDTLKDISGTPWFGDVVKKSFQEEKERLLELLKIEKDTELQQIKEKHEIDLLTLESELEKEVKRIRNKYEDKLLEFSKQQHSIENKLQEKNIEIELLNETIEEKSHVVANLEKSISNLQERKNSIIQDFSIVREVLYATEIPQMKSTKEVSKSFSLEEINFSDKPIIRYQAYIKSLENILKENGSEKREPAIMGKILAKYKIVLCPSVSIAQTFIMASHKCRYLTEYASAKWGGFEDLWNNGLAYIVSKSEEEPETMHFLLLQNINISYLPNFLQPLVDLQTGFITKFPTSNISWPENLRILCTITDEELIRMPASILKFFGCIDKALQFDSSQAMNFADDASLGYLTPEELNKIRKELCSEEEENKLPNMFNQYIDE